MATVDVSNLSVWASTSGENFRWSDSQSGRQQRPRSITTAIFFTLSVFRIQERWLAFQRVTASALDCCVPLCTMSSRYNREVSFHAFPVDAAVRAEWMQQIRRDDFNPTKFLNAYNFQCISPERFYAFYYCIYFVQVRWVKTICLINHYLSGVYMQHIQYFTMSKIYTNLPILNCLSYHTVKNVKYVIIILVEQ